MTFNGETNFSATRMLAAYVFSSDDDTATAFLSQSRAFIMGSCIVAYIIHVLVLRKLESRFITLLSDELVVRVKLISIRRGYGVTWRARSVDKWFTENAMQLVPLLEPLVLR